MSSKKRAYSKLCEQQFFLEYHYWEMRKMTTFLIGLAILIIGGFLYGSFVERIFKPDDRQTPAVKLEKCTDQLIEHCRNRTNLRTNSGYLIWTGCIPYDSYWMRHQWSSSWLFKWNDVAATGRCTDAGNRS